MQSLWVKFNKRLHEPIEIAPLVVFRVLFGVIVVVEQWRYYKAGWFHHFYVEPKFFFTYSGFDWVRPLSPEWIYALVITTGVAAAFIAIGFLYRLSCVALLLSFSYLFFIDQSHYLNHFYLVILITFLLCFLSPHRSHSIDVRIWTSLQSSFSENWQLWILRFQVGLVYIYGGISKLNPDWLRGEPMRIWLFEKRGNPYFGELFAQEWVAYLFSYGGLLFDLMIVPLIFWKRTRVLAVIGCIAFNITNGLLFHIGLFPWFMVAALLLFFPHETVGQLFPKVFPKNRGKRLVAMNWVAPAFCVYVSWQVLMPARQLLYPGRSVWSGEAYNFSWRMKNAHYRTQTLFFTVDPVSGERMEVDADDWITPKQKNAMIGNPDMIHQMAIFMGERLKRQLGKEMPVYVDVRASLNGRPFQYRIDPNVDLSKVPRDFRVAEWVVPLKSG